MEEWQHIENSNYLSISIEKYKSKRSHAPVYLYFCPVNGLFQLSSFYFPFTMRAIVYS